MKKILVCINHRANPNTPSCHARGSQQVLAQLSLRLKQENIKIAVEKVQCLGHCNSGPNVRLVPNEQFFHNVASESLTEIITATRLFLTS